MNRTSEYNRFKRHCKIERKKKIIKSQHDYWHYKYEGELSKGKIHCSCPYCTMKRKNLGPKFSEIRKMLYMEDYEDAS